MVNLNRSEIMRSAAEIYEQEFGSSPSTILVGVAVEQMLPQCETREGKAALLGRIAEMRALFLPLENLSPISQETFDICNAVISAIDKALRATN